ncbi:MAG: hypothetical protein NVS9B7_29490 [Flavisolibacter sp.]
MRKVTTSELSKILYAMQFQKGSSVIASVLQYTDAKLLKKGNPYATAKKLSKVSIFLNTEYEKGVLNQLARENKEGSEYLKGKNTMPLVFGENNNFIGNFNGKDAIQYRPNTEIKSRVKYIFDSKIIDKTKIESFLPKVSPATNQGTDKEILWRKLYVENIRKIAIGKEVYKVVEQ